jgi:hypothetical protein
MPPVDRFWTKVRKSPNGCWEWIGCFSDTGYGNFYADGSLRLTHRYSWTLHVGAIPKGLCVLHRCDNRACVRPDHLFLGTKKDNTRDMFYKGRERNLGICKGEQHGNSKLTLEQVLRIRAESAAGRKHREMAAEMGVTESLVSKVVHRKVWTHV